MAKIRYLYSLVSVPFLSRPFVFDEVKNFLASIGKGYPFRKIVRFLSGDNGDFCLLGKFPKPSVFLFTTYYTAQGGFAEVLIEIFKIISYVLLRRIEKEANVYLTVTKYGALSRRTIDNTYGNRYNYFVISFQKG